MTRQSSPFSYLVLSDSIRSPFCYIKLESTFMCGWYLLEFDRLDLAFFVIDHFSSSFVNRSLVFCLHFIFAILLDQINRNNCNIN